MDPGLRPGVLGFGDEGGASFLEHDDDLAGVLGWLVSGIRSGGYGKLISVYNTIDTGYRRQLDRWLSATESIDCEFIDQLKCACGIIGVVIQMNCSGQHVLKEFMPVNATNRQRKLLRFFGMKFHKNISAEDAGWEISRIMSNFANKEMWDRYLFVTRDFSTETDEVMPYDISELERIELPHGWDSQREVKNFQSEFVHFIVTDESPYSQPQPKIEFNGKSFCFTGKFGYGQRKDCVVAIEARGGLFSSYVAVGLDYLVIGALDSPCWVRDNYGRKIEKAILLRREQGRPAIVSEDHWQKCLDGG